LLFWIAKGGHTTLMIDCEVIAKIKILGDIKKRKMVVREG
jgi:hypothetical protein